MRIAALDHVGLHVEDVDASVGFYGGVLGLEPIDRPDLGFPGAWLGIGTGQAIHLIGRPVDAAARVPRERHVALLVDDLDAFVARLEAEAIAFDGPKPRPDGARQVFVRDPDGHVVELLAT